MEAAPWSPHDNWLAGSAPFIKTAFQHTMNPVAYPPRSPRLRDWVGDVMRYGHYIACAPRRLDSQPVVFAVNRCVSAGDGPEFHALLQVGYCTSGVAEVQPDDLPSGRPSIPSGSGRTDRLDRLDIAQDQAAC